MDQPVELVPLMCVRCSTPLPAQPDEVAWVCAQCGQGLVLDDDKGLAELEVKYTDVLAPNATGYPHWVFDGRVTIHRQTYSGNRAGESQDFWGQGRRFCIPAYTCPHDELIEHGTRLLVQPPPLREGPPSGFKPVTLSAADAIALAEFIVVAAEAGRSDMLKELQFTLETSDPELWIFP